jgi:hypothetical protein
MVVVRETSSTVVIVSYSEYRLPVSSFGGWTGWRLELPAMAEYTGTCQWAIYIFFLAINMTGFFT